MLLVLGLNPDRMSHTTSWLTGRSEIYTDVMFYLDADLCHLSSARSRSRGTSRCAVSMACANMLTSSGVSGAYLMPLQPCLHTCSCFGCPECCFQAEEVSANAGSPASDAPVALVPAVPAPGPANNTILSTGKPLTTHVSLAHVHVSHVSETNQQD